MILIYDDTLNYYFLNLFKKYVFRKKLFNFGEKYLILNLFIKYLKYYRSKSTLFYDRQKDTKLVKICPLLTKKFVINVISCLYCFTIVISNMQYAKT